MSVSDKKGIGVAILDTGIFPHRDFRNRISGFYDFVSNRSIPYDDNGHGTHVAGILAGDGTVSNGKICGIAPHARIVALKILDKKGNGEKESLLQASKWLKMNGKSYGIRIINISLGMPCTVDNIDQAVLDGVDSLWEQGYIVVAAAGNRSMKSGGITLPGCSKKIITVGCSDMLLWKNSDFNPETARGEIKKPDITAPGYRIIACAPGNTYCVKSGTSMATPYISGMIALLLEKNPKLTNEEIKQRLKKCTDSKIASGILIRGKIDEKKFLKI